ncbi:MAG: hypothetical protein JHC93_03245 [Parachlamydiales bacterium]|nr:hypothetical protein [Parachlamydiales bacterium]
MTNNFYLPIFQEILASNALDRLEEFKEPSLWTQMTSDERELLAMLFTLQGERALITNEQKALEIFILALRIAPSNAQIFYRQGLAWFTYAKRQHQERCLSLANQNLQKATSFNPAFTDAWYTWGNVLVEMGLTYGDLNYFQEADEKFLTAYELLKGNEETQGALCWDWGLNWYYLGKQSGEAIDFRVALEKFEEAKILGCSGSAFWCDLGNTFSGMAELMGSVEWYLKAEEAYKQATSDSPEDASSWFHLGLTHCNIHEMNGQEEYFDEASKSLSKSLDLNPSQLEAWVRFGQLCINEGKIKHELSLIEDGLEKFAKADIVHPGHPQIQCRWGEALMLLGVYRENLQFLKQAEEKLAVAANHFPDNPDIWYSYGLCLHELGHYFGDEEFFMQAIEKFQYGLSIDNARASLWHGLSQTHFALGEMRCDFLMVEQSGYYCSRASELQPKQPQFWNDWGVALLKMAEMTNLKQYVEEALVKFEHAFSLRNGMENTPEMEWLYHYGCGLDFLGDFDGTAELYEKSIQVLSFVLDKDPQYIHARYNLALALSHLGEVSAEPEHFLKAIEYFRQIIEEDKEDEMVWNDWGLALLNLAELSRDFTSGSSSQQLREEAESKLLQAAALGNVQSFYNLACLYSLMGCFRSAMYFLERAEIHGGLPPLEDVLHDEWLDALKHTEMFRHFVNQLKNKTRI